MLPFCWTAGVAGLVLPAFEVDAASVENMFLTILAQVRLLVPSACTCRTTPVYLLVPSASPRAQHCL
jgi:hypothetical protein